MELPPRQFALSLGRPAEQAVEPVTADGNQDSGLQPAEGAKTDLCCLPLLVVLVDLLQQNQHYSGSTPEPMRLAKAGPMQGFLIPSRFMACTLKSGP